ncbi:sugar ABC transporter permease [Oceanotoga sp. DSM 15011]|uniref:carbohydrate ABC transporter permease n=1 Tax=Oceanotoga TaxID=1255275 RepID=UPI0021F4C253|nr:MULTISPECIES: sugar ABC transporter permease [Oceanotoga]MDO7977403.1 sugar ABC transporter permease [Oceanotoga teriensis]UYO98916.1 sugar ABC transporter permease [Oceanotoga sp. DSM 15011]
MRTRTSTKSIIMFLGPAIILLMIFLILPMIASFFISLTNFNTFALADWSKAKFIGFENFIDLFKDELFWKSLFNTFYALIIAMPLTIILALFFAVLINREQTYFKNFFKVGFYLPFVTNTVAIAIVWKWILNPEYGLLNWFLGLFGINGPNWIGDPNWAMPSIIMLVVWKALGYNIIIFYAGLQNIPEFLYEAAELDGASRWQQFLKITVPMLRPTTYFVSVMVLIGYLQLFEEPYMLTNGGPLDSTLSVVLYLYRQGFKFFNLGYASSIAVILFLIIFILTILQTKLKKTEY